MAAIKVEHLSKSFSYYKKDVGLKSSIKNLFYRKKLIKEAVNDISFELNEGEIIGFLGPNGAGKTTTLKMLSGILVPTSGEISVLGYVPWERKNALKKQFSIVMGQKSQLWWDLPANESLYLNKCIYEIDDKEYSNTIGELSELLDVKDLLNVQVRRLSLGERMKLELMASLMHKPKVLYLDEPTIGLDIISQRKIREFLKVYNKEMKTTIILTSHYMNDVEDLCNKAIIINKGKLVFNGELTNINQVFGNQKLIKLVFSQKVSEGSLKNYGEVKEYNEYNAVIQVMKDDVKHKSRKLLDTLPVLDINIESIPLEAGIELLYKRGDHIEE